MRNQVICRYVLPHRLSPSLALLGRPSRDRHPPAAYFPPDCHPRGSRNGTPRYVLCREKEPFPLPRIYYTHAHRYVYKGPVLHFVRYPPAFIPPRIDITRSATSTLKPLSTFSLSRPLDETLESETLPDNGERVMLLRYIICFYTTRYARKSFSLAYKTGSLFSPVASSIS